MSLENFWGDWQHSSDDHKPAGYTAIRIQVFQCGKCRSAIDHSHWPSYCLRCGARNEKPQ